MAKVWLKLVIPVVFVVLVETVCAHIEGNESLGAYCPGDPPAPEELRILRNGTNDPCARVAGQQFVSRREAIECLRNFAFSKRHAEYVYRVLRRVLLRYYVFADDALKSHPNQTSVNIFDELVRVRQNFRKYQTDYDVQLDFFKAVLKLNDYSTRYAPTCYLRPFKFIRPLPVVAVGSTVYVGPVSQAVADHVRAVTTSDPSQFEGWEVVSIDGQNPLMSIFRHASQNVGTSKDPATRLNLAMAHSVWSDQSAGYEVVPGDWSASFMDFAGGRNSVTYKLRPPNSNSGRGRGPTLNVTYPIIASNQFYPYGFTDSRSFWNNYCRAAYLPTSPSTSGPRTTVPIGVSESAFASGPGLRALHLGTRTLVLHIRRFNGGSADNVLSATSFLLQVVAYIRSERLTRAVIDVSSNRGGDLCWGYILAKYLSGINTNINLQYPTRISRAPLISIMAQSVYNYSMNPPIGGEDVSNNHWLPSKYRVSPSLNPLKDASWVQKQVVDECPLNVLDPVISGLPPFPIPLRHLAAVSNGECFGACSIFISVLRHKASPAVQTVSLGGSPSLNLKPTVSSSTGGQRVTYQSLVDEAEFFGVNRLISCPLKPFSTQVELTFVLREALRDRQSRIPLEYISNTPTAWVPYTLSNALNVTQQWSDVAKLMFGRL
mmetsp:Transcript_27252/g.44403  ORF Transcript_27252/g.44403 Transcript_27252/m.44403 type:complete len:659 (+) Transcript_27252:184-2160(+)